jgi:GrpB-like predicted nucleotidyltransferase (UPF0157 family)
MSRALPADLCPPRALGLRSGTVRLRTSDPRWKSAFAAERRRIARAWPTRMLRIEHIGSTAIAGVRAKPILDLAIQVPQLRPLRPLLETLTRLGYAYRGLYGLRGRHFFTLGTPVTHHLHLVQTTSPHWRRWLLFRDYLRANPREAQAYDTLKQALASRFQHDRDSYTRAKTVYVERVLRKARATEKMRVHC